jgi:hypothetical protein
VIVEKIDGFPPTPKALVGGSFPPAPPAPTVTGTLTPFLINIAVPPGNEVR